MNELSRWDMGKQLSLVSAHAPPPVYSNSQAGLSAEPLAELRSLTTSIRHDMESSASLIDDIVGQAREHVALDVPGDQLCAKELNTSSPFAASSAFENFFYRNLLPLERSLGEVLE